MSDEIKKLKDEIESCNDMIWTFQLREEEYRRAFKEWAYHTEPCRSGISVNNQNCTCGLSEFINEMDL